MGDEPYIVMAGVIVDAQRMHVTKDAWNAFLELLSLETKRTITEFHFRDFYRGSGPWHKFYRRSRPWHKIDSDTRAQVVSSILDWISTRRHHITFSAVDKKAFVAQKASGGFEGIPTAWCAAAVHCILSLQRHHQRIKNNKGHTVVVFDREAKEEGCLGKLVLAPPIWTDSYYDKPIDQSSLDQIVDVPFFVDSEQALLIQVADAISYILRAYAEIETGVRQETYPGERACLSGWVAQICECAIPSATRYPSKGSCPAARSFRDVSPECLRR